MHNMGRDKRASITFGSSGNTKVTSMGSQNAVNRSQINQTQIYSKRGKARGEAHYLSQTGAQKGNMSKLGSSIEYNSRGFKEQSSFNFTGPMRFRRFQALEPIISICLIKQKCLKNISPIYELAVTTSIL